MSTQSAKQSPASFHSFDIGTMQLDVGYLMLKTAVVPLCALAFAYFNISDKYCNKGVNAELGILKFFNVNFQNLK